MSHRTASNRRNYAVLYMQIQVAGYSEWNVASCYTNTSSTTLICVYVALLNMLRLNLILHILDTYHYLFLRLWKTLLYTDLSSHHIFSLELRSNELKPNSVTAQARAGAAQPPVWEGKIFVCRLGRGKACYRCPA